MLIPQNKNIYAVYWIINSQADNTNMDYKTYQKKFNNCIHNHNVLEFIITAPELPIKYIDKNLNFIRINNKEEVDRMNYYSIIYEQEINFCKDLLLTFKDYNVNFACNELVNLINTFYNIIDNDDKEYLKNVKLSISEDCSVYINLFDNLNKERINKLAWWIPIRKWRNGFRDKFFR